MGSHRGEPDRGRIAYVARFPKSGATDRNKAKHTPESPRAFSHSPERCPACDPEGYAAHASKHRA